MEEVKVGVGVEQLLVCGWFGFRPRASSIPRPRVHEPASFRARLFQEIHRRAKKIR
jgi:hypothetical protein